MLEPNPVKQTLVPVQYRPVHRGKKASTASRRHASDGAASSCVGCSNSPWADGVVEASSVEIYALPDLLHLN
jgi:hypothetical protein